MRVRPGYLSVLFLAAVASVVVLSQGARAGQLADEGFKPSFPIYANGGTGYAGP